MKLSTKFLILIIVVTAVFSVSSAWLVQSGLNEIRKSEYFAVVSVAEAVKKKYPEINDRELVELLNSNYGGRQTEDILKRYGINKDVYLMPEDSRYYSGVVMLVFAAVLGFGAVTVVIIGIYGSVKTRREKKLTNYLARINSGDYSIISDKLTEDPASVLEAEIYKTTVMLREKSEQLKKEKESLKDSLSDISHQLKTPITSIMIMLENILDGEMPEEMQKEFISDIKNSAEHISSLIQALLTLSKLDADTIEFKKQKMSVKSLLKTGMDRTAAIASSGKVSVKLECDDAELECDPKWMCEALTNIIKNCIEHTPADGTVCLSCEDNPLLLKIEISDTGCGIDKKDLPHIFERFYKGKNSGEQSVGIGLAMAKAITEKHGGYITVSSETGKGSRFILKFFKTDGNKNISSGAEL